MKYSQLQRFHLIDSLLYLNAEGMSTKDMLEKVNASLAGNQLSRITLRQLQKDLKDMKDMLFALQKYGVDNLPAKIIVKGLLLWMKGVTNPEKLRNLYGKYIGNWGGKSVQYKFEAYRNGKLVKTVIRTPAKNTTVKAVAKRLELSEGNTYDVTSVSLRATDENGNIQSFCQEALTLRTEGEIEILGPTQISLKGGLAGTYVRTKGKAGKGTLYIKDWKGCEQAIAFTIKTE